MVRPSWAFMSLLTSLTAARRAANCCKPRSCSWEQLVPVWRGSNADTTAELVIEHVAADGGIRACKLIKTNNSTAAERKA